MLWVYDEAIVEDLTSCVNPTGEANINVKMMGNEGIIGVLAQLQSDRVSFPIIFLDRHADTPIDRQRYNFSRMHKGVPAVVDTESNTMYLEKSIPIDLKYDLHVLTTNVTDMDEMMKEIIFRYSDMYFLTLELPYEDKRKIRFGMAINPDTSITRKSAAFDYMEDGKIYESILELECQGAVMLSYTPRHMERMILDDAVQLKAPKITFNKD